jgi:hypothetical protein
MLSRRLRGRLDSEKGRESMAPSDGPVGRGGAVGCSLRDRLTGAGFRKSYFDDKQNMKSKRILTAGCVRVKDGGRFSLLA